MMQSPNTLTDILKKDGNNFDIFRLIAALSVIIGHAYAIAPHPPLQDGILSLLHFDYSGSLAVKFFFFLSGLLVTNSIITKPDALQFAIKRACRILPGLLVCLLISVFIIGPLLTRLSLSRYFSNYETWTYIGRNLLLYNMQWRLPGVLDESRYGLNGSLWTLPHEVLCYLYLAIFFGLGILRNKIVADIFFCLVIVVCFISPHYLPQFFTQNQEAVLLPGCFSLGALAANNKSSVKIGLTSVILLLVLMVLLRNSAAFQFVFYIFLFYTVIYIASIDFVKQRLKLPFDASYGVYIYGFMIQQCLHVLLPGMGLHLHQLVASMIAILMGIMSWYFVEKRFILLGHRITSGDFWPALTRKVTALLRADNTIYQKLYHPKLSVFLILTGIAFIVHALVLRFIFPGYYSPFYPQHSDFYIPAAFAHSTFSFVDLLKWPRPVNMIAAKFFGYFGIQGSIACVIVIGAMICATSALIVRRILNLSFDRKFIFVFVAYCYLVFSEPFFYTFFAQDIGAQVSYFLLISGAYVALSFGSRQILANVVLFICCLLAFLSKETYALTALLFAFLWFLYERKHALWRAALPFFSISLSLVVTFLINFSIKSAFVNPDASAKDPYHISLKPSSVLHEWLLYAKEGMNLANVAMLLLIAGYFLFRYKDNSLRNKVLYLTAGCLAGAMVSWIPNALLPNHHFKGYSFNGAFLIFLPLFLLPLIPFSWRISKGLPLALLLLLCFGSPLLNLDKYADNKWVLIQENTQRNLLHAIEPLIGSLHPGGQPQKILIRGITFPFHPFAFPQSLRVFPNAQYAAFDVVNYNPAVKTGLVNDLVRFINPADTAATQYQQVWTFSDEGKLVTAKNPLAEKIFDSSKLAAEKIVEIKQDNFSSFITYGFYNEENGIRWTNGNASIQLQNTIEGKDSLIVQLNTYMPPVCKDVNPRLALLAANNKTYEAAVVNRKDNIFYYFFLVNRQDSIKGVRIQSETINAASDARILSFPFVSMMVK